MDLQPPNKLRIGKKHTQAELQAFHDELKRYEASLRRWDMQLQEREDAVEQAEQALMDGDECACGFEEMAAGCGCEWCEELREGIACGSIVAQSYARFQAQAKDRPPSGDELAFLERLGKLKDPRG